MAKIKGLLGLKKEKKNDIVTTMKKVKKEIFVKIEEIYSL